MSAVKLSALGSYLGLYRTEPRLSILVLLLTGGHSRQAISSSSQFVLSKVRERVLEQSIEISMKVKTS